MAQLRDRDGAQNAGAQVHDEQEPSRQLLHFGDPALWVIASEEDGIEDECWVDDGLVGEISLTYEIEYSFSAD